MSTFKSTNDIKIAVLKRCGEVADGSSDYDTDAITYINNFHRALIAGGNEFDVDCGEPWIWATATSPQLLTLQLPYLSGSVAVTQGSATVTLSLPPAFSVAGWHLKIEGRPDFFLVVAHDASSATATIDMPYPESTATGLTFKLVKLRYQLPSPVQRFVGPMLTNNVSAYVRSIPEQGLIAEVDLQTFMRKHSMINLVSGIPTAFCVVSQTTDDIVTVQFNSYLADYAVPVRVEVPYIAPPADLIDSTTNYPLIPIAYRDLLVHAASYYIMLDKSDNRQDTELQLAKARLMSLISFNRKSLSLSGINYGKLVPRPQGSRVRRQPIW